MQIREGAYYITRDGSTVGPATPNHGSSYPWNIPHNDNFLAYHDDGTICIDNRDWDIVAEVPTRWRNMTPEQKGALLLAHHEGKVIETLFGKRWVKVEPEWNDDAAYRVRAEPVRNSVEMKWGLGSLDTHRITFDLLDGEPDCTSIKMEKV